MLGRCVVFLLTLRLEPIFQCYSLIQQVLTEHLLCAVQSSGSRDTQANKTTTNVCEAESQLLHEEVRVQVTYSTPSTPSCTHVGKMKKWFSPEDYFSAVLLWGKGSAFLNNLQKQQIKLYFIQQSRTVDCGFLFNFCICRLSLSRYIRN